MLKLCVIPSCFVCIMFLGCAEKSEVDKLNKQVSTIHKVTNDKLDIETYRKEQKEFYTNILANVNKHVKEQFNREAQLINKELTLQKKEIKINNERNETLSAKLKKLANNINLLIDEIIKDINRNNLMQDSLLNVKKDIKKL